MSGFSLVTTLVAYGVACWLGLYLLSRDPRKATLRRAGVGLLGYAGVLACLPFTDAPIVETAAYLLSAVPALAWTGVLIALLPEETALRATADRAWRYACVPTGAVAVIAAGVFGPIVGWPVYVIVGVIVLVPLAAMLVVATLKWRQIGPGTVAVLVPVATVLFLLGAAALLVPSGWFSPVVMTASIGGDLMLVGVLVAVFDAFAEGERLPADMRRSALAAAGGAALFGGQVGLVMAGVGGSVLVRALLFSTVGAAIALVVLARPLQGALDQVAFRGSPELTAAREDLREAADALPRRDESHPLADLDETEFARLVRQALRHYGDLGKLVSSPLTSLPAIATGIAERGAADHPLERAAELKSQLLAGIERLRPGDERFGTADEWRHFNALYFIYVVGVRPYRRQTDRGGLDPVSREAFDWFRRYVPERTLYNWQNSAARAVAADLKARNWQ